MATKDQVVAFLEKIYDRQAILNSLQRPLTSEEEQQSLILQTQKEILVWVLHGGGKD